MLHTSTKIQPLTKIKIMNVKFKHNYVDKEVFEEIKFIVTHDTLLIFPDLNKFFDIHNYESVN